MLRVGRDIGITGVGIVTAIGQGKDAFAAALMAGRHEFSVMKRPGRQKGTKFIGAELPALALPPREPARHTRISLSAQAALVAVYEAWIEAKLEQVDPCRIGIVIGGSNIQQREITLLHDAYVDRLPYLPPSYAVSFLDMDICGICTEYFGIRGLCCTIGGASASGQLAVMQALHAVTTGRLDICIAVGALMDLSYWECQAFRSLGAMGTENYQEDPGRACRPFDRDRDGFIFGEACGAVVVENLERINRSGVVPKARLAGGATVQDANRNPNPSYEGERAAIENALRAASLPPRRIDYVNPHGSGSILGDEIELRALADCNFSHAAINATKSIVGHAMSAAGIVEIIATLIQMKAAKLHPTRNLDNPISPSLNWVAAQAVDHRIENALNISLGFGGLNTALCISAI